MIEEKKTKAYCRFDPKKECPLVSEFTKPNLCLACALIRVAKALEALPPAIYVKKL